MLVEQKAIIYGKQDCKYCTLAKEVLSANGIAFEYRDIEETPQYRDVVKYEMGKSTVPQIILDDKLIGGYDELVQFLGH